MKDPAGQLSRPVPRPAQSAAPPSSPLATSLCALFWALFSAAPGLEAAVLKVPSDHPTIAAAVRRASDGDTVLVDDGVYLECNIEIAKDIAVRSRRRFGAVVYGSKKPSDAIFVVKAAARIEGFVLKGAATGILQRDSPDVEWRATDLAIFDCSCGISVNDAAENIGSVRVRNVAIFGRGLSYGITTNDAGVVDVSDCLVAGCAVAFHGYDHYAFRVSGGAVLDCGRVIEESSAYQPAPPATSRIETGGGLRVVRTGDLREREMVADLLSFLGRSVFGADDAGARRAPAPPDAALALVALIEGRIELENGRHAAATGCFRRAFDAAGEAGSEEFAWRAILETARAAQAARRPADAAAAYREAVDRLEKWVPAVPMGLDRTDFLDDKTQAYLELVGLLLDAHGANPAERWDRLAFSYAERYRALTRLQSPRARGLGPEAEAAVREISARQAKLRDPEPSGEAKEALVRDLERAEQDYHGALVREERAAFEGFERAGAGGAIRSFRPFDGPEAFGRLKGRAALSYLLGEKESFAFLATERGLEAARLPAAARIAGLVEPYLRFLQLAGSRDFKGAAAGRLLFDLLVGPFADRLRSGPSRVVIVPDGRLRYLPFETLVADGGAGGAPPRFWGESVDISYDDSLDAALEGKPRRAAGTGGPERGPAVLAVGCSDGIRCDNRSRRFKRFFSPLAFVRGEIVALAGLFRGRDVTAMIDEVGCEARLKAMDVSRFDVIHLAAHGVIDDEGWWRSALLLRPDPAAGEDGFLTALEIARLELGGGIVVLSGCGTGAGPLSKGEGIRGLSGAFRRAGAGPLVVSLWNVDDRATAALMERFYRALAAGTPAAEALAGAKRQMIAAGYRNPFFWAPFVLIGDGAAATIR